MDDMKMAALILVCVTVMVIGAACGLSYSNYLNAGLIRDCIRAGAQPQVSLQGTFQTCIPGRGVEK